MSKTRVAIMLDKDNNWLESHVLPLGEDLVLNERYTFDFHLGPAKVQDYEIVFILGYTKILSNEFLSSNKLNLVIHESALPKGKGFSPVQWQILEGQHTIPVSLIEAVEGVDSGDIFGTGVLELDGSELYDEIREKQAETTINMITSFLSKYPNHERRIQEGKESTYMRRTVKDDELDPDLTIREQFNKLRIANNEEYPVYFKLGDQQYNLKISRRD